MKNACIAVSLIAALSVGGCQSKQVSSANKLTEADGCIEGGPVYDGRGGYNQTILIVKDGKIFSDMSDGDGAAISCSDLVASGTEIIDLKGAYLYPGFVDSHAHLLEIGLREMTLNLEDVASIEAIKALVIAQINKTPKGETVYGRGWIETHWPEKRFINKTDLDLIAPDHPVVVQRWGGHAVAVNTMALELAGITKDTQPPFGGKILLGEDGEPNGMLIDNAQSLVDDLIGELTPARREAAYIKGSELYAAAGWTGIQSMSVVAGDVGLIGQLSDQGKLKIRVYNAIDMDAADALIDKMGSDGPQQNQNGHVTTRNIKLYADGALGSRGAALLEPYADRPGDQGLMLIEKQTIMPILERALRDGIQMSVHAIGDSANRLVLDWYAEAFEAVPVSERKIAEPRWRIEHSQIMDVSDIPRYQELGVIASMQPSHAILDLHFAVDRLGVERLRGGYAWRSLIDSGAIVAAGSDAPFNGAGEPRIEFYAAVTRKDRNGFSAEGWYPDEKVTRIEALKMLTEWPAYAAFAEENSGTIEVGKNADFTVFDQDILAIPESKLLTINPVMTIVDGKIIYQAQP